MFNDFQNNIVVSNNLFQSQAITFLSFQKDFLTIKFKQYEMLDSFQLAANINWAVHMAQHNITCLSSFFN